MRDIPGTLYITKSNGYYQVTKHSKGKTTHYYNTNNLKDALKVRDELIENGWKKRKRNRKVKHTTLIKGIFKYNNYYAVRHKEKVYAYCKTFIGAVCTQRYYEHNGWKKEWREYGRYGKYITKNGNRYVIQKCNDGELEFINSFTSLEEAQKERDLLVKYDWDYGLLVECEGVNDDQDKM